MRLDRFLDDFIPKARLGELDDVFEGLAERFRDDRDSSANLVPLQRDEGQATQHQRKENERPARERRDVCDDVQCGVCGGRRCRRIR